MDEDAPVADGVLAYLSPGCTSIIGLAVQCPDGRYFGSIKAPGPVYNYVPQEKDHAPRNNMLSIFARSQQVGSGSTGRFFPSQTNQQGR
jgi:hypothetical protein